MKIIKTFTVRYSGETGKQSQFACNIYILYGFSPIDGVVKISIYCVAAHFEILDILYV